MFRTCFKKKSAKSRVVSAKESPATVTKVRRAAPNLDPAANSAHPGTPDVTQAGFIPLIARFRVESHQSPITCLGRRQNRICQVEAIAGESLPTVFGRSIGDLAVMDDGIAGVHQWGQGGKARVLLGGGERGAR
ncbi:hypothetical protein Bbelb_017400 [Branchiostoma belcheri]|nr:hypothetical protein Bbelb_017400 [Branchiostoma belcheri]